MFVCVSEYEQQQQHYTSIKHVRVGFDLSYLVYGAGGA